jgi:hypothetical protein
MKYHEMKYWNTWHSRMEKAEVDAVRKAEEGRGRK